jgi:2-polyprenyl-3-methyl-5-hydroxy-6-metoxy-1,4-benzoquinol methylase
MGEWRLFPEGTVPEYTTSAWYAGRERAPHLEQGGGHTERLHETAAQVHQAAAAHFDVPPTLCDLGAGDGGLLSLLDATLIRAAWGYDLQSTNVDGARNHRNIDVHYGDVIEGWYMPFGPEGGRYPIRFGDIAVATEMLEHLVDPHGFVRRIAEHSKVLIASSPWMERPGAAYEFHTWAWDPDGYRALLEQGGFVVVREQICGGFQVLTGVRP